MNEGTEKVIVGMDISKDKIDIFYLPEERHEVIKNNSRAIGVWVRNVKKKNLDVRVVLEPTGGYEMAMVKKLIEEALDVYQIHPNQVYHYGLGMGFMAKTDKISSKILANYYVSHADKLCTIQQNYAENKRLTELYHRANQLKSSLHAERCRLQHDYFNKFVKQSLKQMIKQLEKQLEGIQEEIDKVIKDNEAYAEKEKLLETFSGVGKVVAQSLILGLPELGHINRAQISKLIGVAPINKDSGKKEGHRKIRGGRFDVRKALYMAALCASRHNPEMRAYYEKLLQQGKLKKVALVAVMRKMICILNAMVRENRPWLGANELAAQNG